MNVSFDNDDNKEEKLNLDDLYDKKKEIDQLRISIYKKVLQRIHSRIKHVSRQYINDQFIFYVIPEYMIGVPRYNVNHCTYYVIDKLKENGFHVHYTHPNMLFISWKHYIPKYERDTIKKTYGIQIDGFGNKINSKKSSLNQLSIENLPTKNNKKNDEYRDVKLYKPSGIYDDAIFKNIEKSLR